MIQTLLGIGGLLAAGGRIYCEAKEYELEAERDNYLKKQDRKKPVELVSSNYKGKKKYEKAIGSVETCWYKSISRAKDELKERARKLGGNMILNVEVYQDTDSEPGPKGGIHKYTVWKASGMAVKK